MRWSYKTTQVDAFGRGDGPEEPEVNLLASEAEWAWPEAVRQIFRPRGVNLLVANDVEQFVQIIQRKRIHAAIVDTDPDCSAGLTTIRIIRMEYPRVPCIALASTVEEHLLGKALQLEVFSVIGKPVDLGILQEQLNRLFIKKYSMAIFGP